LFLGIASRVIFSTWNPSFIFFKKKPEDPFKKQFSVCHISTSLHVVVVVVILLLLLSCCCQFCDEADNDNATFAWQTSCHAIWESGLLLTMMTCLIDITHSQSGRADNWPSRRLIWIEKNEDKHISLLRCTVYVTDKLVRWLFLAHFWSLLMRKFVVSLYRFYDG
jgi:hypothetical protein